MRTKVLVGIIAGLSLLAAACGDDDAEDAADATVTSEPAGDESRHGGDDTRHRTARSGHHGGDDRPGPVEDHLAVADGDRDAVRDRCR